MMERYREYPPIDCPSALNEARKHGTITAFPGPGTRLRGAGTPGRSALISAEEERNRE